MPKRSSKSKDTQQLARSVLNSVVPDAEPPKKQSDAADIERADSEGMMQPQGIVPKEKNPAAVALGRLGGKVGGKARAAKLSPEQRAEIAKKAATARWKRS